MIFSGWILPDYYEVYCPSTNNCKDHIEIVSKYLTNLKEIDASTYNYLMSRLYSKIKVNQNYSLDDFAVYYLGWIKLGDFPFKCIDCSGHDFQLYIINKYIKLGYDYVHIYDRHEYYLDVKISSERLLP